MSTRPSRSSSIPIPRSSTSTSPSRNIEDVISIPFAVPRRGGLFSRNARGELSTSPVRPSARSYPRSAGMLSRSTPRTTTFEPRIVRAEQSRTTDPTCSTTSTRTRRASGTGRAPSAQRQSSGHIMLPSPLSPPAPFTRPAYLDHAALRYLLQAEPPSLLPPLRKAESASYDSRTYSPSSDSDEDRTTGPSVDDVLRLPTRWSDCRHQSLNVSSDGRDLTFQGANCNNDREGVAGAARTDYSIPPACGIYYYEVEVRSKSNTAHISIGLTGPDVKVSRLPGWEDNSWGYHGDDGRSFASEKSGTNFGPTYGTGDVIGCGVDFTTGRVFFTKNGLLIDYVFKDVGKDVKLYPSVGLKHTNDSIRVNLGQDPFKYDIEFHVQNQRNNAWSSILSRPMPLSVVAEGATPASISVDGMVEDDTKATLNNLVMSYLGHHGYTKTLRALQKDSRQEPVLESAMDTDVLDSPSLPHAHERGVESRTHIVQSVMTGDLDTAISETQIHHPAVLDADEGLMLFKLRCRKFIELIMETVELKKALHSRKSRIDDDIIDGMDVDVDAGMDMDVDDGIFHGGNPTARYETALSDAISYGQTLRNDYKSDHRAEVKSIFMKTFGIVAFEDPRDAGGEVAEVVGHEARVALANELNQAILRSQGRPPQPALETFYRHAAVCVQQLALLGVGFAPFVDMKREFLDA
ncbi:SPRY-domain-containing protein [Hymenopellis radicata]|nr:SPRY-domain-containing protein [Hymenopellis radicata]